MDNGSSDVNKRQSIQIQVIGYDEFGVVAADVCDDEFRLLMHVCAKGFP